jgi:hypothetical protein
MNYPKEQSSSKVDVYKLFEAVEDLYLKLSNVHQTLNNWYLISNLNYYI